MNHFMFTNYIFQNWKIGNELGINELYIVNK